MNAVVAGRDLDELIAVRVMGWKTYGRHKGIGSTWTAPEGHNASYGSWPAYSADVSAAWFVVEAMADRGWAFDARYDREPWGEHIAHATFTAVNVEVDRPECGRQANAGATTVPLAICLAALNALAADGAA